MSYVYTDEIVRIGIVIIVVLCVVPVWADEPIAPGCDSRRLEAAFDEMLLETKPIRVYYSDGAADGSIFVAGPEYTPHSTVRPFMKCLEAAAPVLVGRLDDARPTPFLFSTGPRGLLLKQASVGHIALDILLALSPLESEVYIDECHDDGLGSCVTEGFYFRPDAWSGSKTEYLADPVVFEVQNRWRTLLDLDLLQLESPAWLRPQEDR